MTLCLAAALLVACSRMQPRPETTTAARPSPPGSTPLSPEATRTPPPTPTAAAFSASVHPVTAELLPHSWRPGCPVGPEDLRLLRVTHWGFDGRPTEGELVVHRDEQEAVLEIMRRLFDARFPIERMEPVDEFGGSDDASMAANNTSAYNCREVKSRPGVWSEHAYGAAIDVNPIQNPYVSSSGMVDPPAGAQFVDRSQQTPGMIHAGDPAVRAFAAVGWGWGGHWSASKDYQHFSRSGR